MRFSKFCHTLYVATLIAVLLAAPTRSFADSFEVVLLTNDDATFLGLSSNGTAYFDYNFGGCGPRRHLLQRLLQRHPDHQQLIHRPHLHP